MIYGNKFLGHNSLAAITFEQDIININNTISLITEDTEIVTESKIGDIINALFNKFKEALTKILDFASKLFKKVLPFIYNFIQKLIAEIKNSMVPHGNDKIEFQGKLNLTYEVISSDLDKWKIELNNANLYKDIQEMSNIYDSDTMKELMGLKTDTFADLKVRNKELADMVNSWNLRIEDKLADFNDFLSADVKDFLEMKTYLIESVEDYFKFRDILEDIIDKNKESQNNLRVFCDSLQRAINNIEFSGALKASSATLFFDQKISTPKSSLLNDIARIYSKFLDIYTASLKSEINVVNRISKYGRYTVHGLDDNLITTHKK